MKKMIILEAVLLIGAFIVPTDIGVYMIMLAIVLPFVIVIAKGIKKAKKEKPVPKAAITEPVEPRKITYDEYLWLQDTEDVGNKFFQAYKDDLEENDDYHMTKKEILEEYYDGDKIYKYEPFLLPFKVEDGKVYSYIKEDEWIYVGSLKKRDIAKYERSKRTELYLMPNYFKKVYDDSVETDSGDSYFGLLVILER